ncbi:MAG: cytochrome c, partial [Paracoccaceae bacterium]
MRGMVLTLVLCVTVTAGLAHQGVRNHVVVHRMDLMTAMQDQVKILGDMVRGKTAYDANAATAARAALIALSQDVPARFAPRETDPQ